MADQFVAVSAGAFYDVSATGTSWTASSASSSATWSGVAWDGAVYCAVSNGSSNKAATSPDGVTWTAQTLPSSDEWNAIAWNGTVFCAVASGTKAATSPDGVTWTARTMPAAPSQWNGIAWNGTVFCAISWTGTVAATSPDGITWTAQTLPSSSFWRKIAWNGSVFCAISGTAGTLAATSPDGVTWTSRTLPASATWYDIAWNGTTFCAVGSGTNAATSPDGITWTSRTLPSGGGNWSAIAWNGSVFCAVKQSSTAAATSPDGVTWTARTMDTSQSWQSIAGSVLPIPMVITIDADMTAPAISLLAGSDGVIVLAPVVTCDGGSNGADDLVAPPPTLTMGELISIVNITVSPPSLDSTSVENPYAFLTAPPPAIDIEMAPEAGTLAGNAGAPTLYAFAVPSPVMTASITAPAPLAELGWLSVDLAAPVPTLGATSLTGEIITVTAVAAAPILSADAINPAIITADMAALPPQLSAAIAAGNVADAALLARAPTLQAQALTGEVGTAVLSAATPIMAAAGYPAYIVTVSIVAPAPYLSATAGAVLSANYRTWTLNTRRGALTEYNAFEFNSYAVFNGKVIAAGPAGLVEVGLQSDDAGVPINSTVTTGQESFGSSAHKRVPRVYTSYSTDGDMRFSTITTEGGTRTYALDWNHLHGVQQRRVPVGKGPKSRFWQFSVANVAGADFSLNDVLVMPTGLRRRVM